MANFAITGAQWGDEGKGKIVDVVSPQFDVVIRFQGGPNAGHSVVFGGERFALHVLPSGIFQKHTLNIIGNGVVVDPASLVKEIEGVTSRGIAITPANLKISERAHIILPYHRIIDKFRDIGENGPVIGTTGRGIGPTYEWKASRRGIRFCDVVDPARFEKKLSQEWAFIRSNFSHIAELDRLSCEQIMEEVTAPLKRLVPHVADTITILAEARARGSRLLFEGAQAVLLDIDFGTYPYVTSSNSSALGIHAGAGVPLNTVDQVIGIFKAYTSRVGSGPFPTELNDSLGEAIRAAGHEFGTTTGRPRRCGWLDLVALKYTHLLSQYSYLAITKLDVLDEFDTIKVATGYTTEGSTTQSFPASCDILESLQPEYREFPGWKTSLANIRTYEELPKQARDYLEFIEDYMQCPIGIVSVGPDRNQTIIRPGRFPNA